MLNTASHLDPKAINNWLDLSNLEHLKALKQVLGGKFWPEGFIPDDVVFPTCWISIICNNLACKAVDEKLAQAEQDAKPCDHQCPNCHNDAIRSSGGPPVCTLCNQEV